MATDPMYRVETQVTGVAGAPYYIVGYFDAGAGTPTAACDDWHEFITGVVTGNATGFPTGSTVATQAAVMLIDPVSGDAIGSAAGSARNSAGVNGTAQLPQSNQILVRWRTGIYVGGREIRGRTNLPCALEEASTTGGQVEAAVVSGIDTRANALISSVDSKHVVWSRKNGQWEESTIASTWNKFSVLRSRRD